ncbi:hypothetical protein ES332_D04G166300v1 [Gossypium tomentosum]|uniref:Uncharacterized protein n=1 Tax=Gossypium tomentosum TaxID=34277 RepID=A0A5D2LEK8_GOSTO|nr:hypothetical protein ES332_D04G166300v1 [Gossypium tomentosum]
MIFAVLFSHCMVADLRSVPLVVELFGVAPWLRIPPVSLGWRLVMVGSSVRCALSCKLGFQWKWKWRLFGNENHTH